VTVTSPPRYSLAWQIRVSEMKITLPALGVGENFSMGRPCQKKMLCEKERKREKKGEKQRN